VAGAVQSTCATTSIFTVEVTTSISTIVPETGKVEEPLAIFALVEVTETPEQVIPTERLS
jgi:hypothetical protein